MTRGREVGAVGLVGQGDHLVGEDLDEAWDESPVERVAAAEAGSRERSLLGAGRGAFGHKHDHANRVEIVIKTASTNSTAEERTAETDRRDLDLASDTLSVSVPAWMAPRMSYSLQTEVQRFW